MPIRTVAEIKVSQYGHIEHFETFFVDGLPTSGQAYPFVWAAERDMWVDKVYFRALATGNASTDIQLLWAPSGTALLNGIALGAVMVADTVADSTNTEYVLYSDTADMAAGYTPRLVPAGGVLGVDFSVTEASALDYIFYIRWRTNTQ